MLPFALFFAHIQSSTFHLFNNVIIDFSVNTLPPLKKIIKLFFFHQITFIHKFNSIQLTHNS